MSSNLAGTASPAPSQVSPWVRRWTHLVAADARVLDLACGSGRHVHWFVSRGCKVTALDRDAAALAALESIAETCVADIESGPWPLAGRSFDAIIVTNYLHRPLMPLIIGSLAPGGVLIYETFGLEQRRIGRPSNPDFLLAPAELLHFARDLRVIAYEDGLDAEQPAHGAVSAEAASGRYVQRIAAAREPAGQPENQSGNEGGSRNGQAPPAWRYLLGPRSGPEKSARPGE